MKKTMVYLPETLHKSLKHLAVEREVSLGEIIREATTVLLEEDHEDLEIAKKRLLEIRRNPSLLADFESYKKRRGVSR